MRGTKALLDKLDKIQDAVQYDVPNTIAKMVSEQTTNAMNGFASAEYDGINDVTVSMETGNNTWSIVAEGESVLFIEYGTGVTFSHTSEFGDSSMYPTASWSATHGQWLVEPKLSKLGGKWPVPGWKNYWTKGNKSANVMYETETALRTGLIIKAKQAVGKAMK